MKEDNPWKNWNQMSGCFAQPENSIHPIFREKENNVLCVYKMDGNWVFGKLGF